MTVVLLSVMLSEPRLIGKVTSKAGVERYAWHGMRLKVIFLHADYDSPPSLCAFPIHFKTVTILDYKKPVLLSRPQSVKSKTVD